MPNAAMFSGLAAALTVVPSQATASSPPIWDHGARHGGSTGHSRQNSSSSGLSPSRRRTFVSPVVAGTCHPAAASAARSPVTSSLTTSAYGLSLNRHNPSTKNTPTRSGSTRNRGRRGSPPAAATSATSPAVTNRDSTPTPTPARIFPRLDDHQPAMPP